MSFQGISSCAGCGLAKLPGANSSGALLLKSSKTIGGWSDVAPAAPTRDGKSQGTPYVCTHRVTCSFMFLGNKSQPTEITGGEHPQISPNPHVDIVDLSTTWALQPESTSPLCTLVHNGAPATALISAAIVASCHHSHHHGDSAQWLPGSRGPVILAPQTWMELHNVGITYITIINHP